MQIRLSGIPSDFNEHIAVMHAVDKPLESITVNHICKRAGISRSKFYEMYKSKYDIGYWYLDLVYRLTLGEIGTTLTWREGIESCLELMHQERNYYNLTAHTPDNVPNLFWMVQSDRIERMEQVLRAHEVELTLKIKAEMRLYAELVDKLLQWWVEPNEFTSSERFAELWLDCIPRELFEGMELRR